MPTKLPLLLVGNNPRNLELLSQFLSKEGYVTYSARTLQDFVTYLDGTYPLGLALVDIAGFDRSIWVYCEKCSDLNIPLLVISPHQATSIRQESISHGAQGILFKPLVVKELTSIISSLALEE